MEIDDISLINGIKIPILIPKTEEEKLEDKDMRKRDYREDSVSNIFEDQPLEDSVFTYKETIEHTEMSENR